MTQTIIDLETENAALEERLESAEKELEFARRTTRPGLTAVYAKLARAERIEKALVLCRDELKRWGWGDFHYGSAAQEQSVVDAVAVADAALEPTPAHSEEPGHSEPGDPA
jgi:hypothetical protein